MRPLSWSTSYLLRLPLGISTSTSNSSTMLLQIRQPRVSRGPRALAGSVSRRMEPRAQPRARPTRLDPPGPGGTVARTSRRSRRRTRRRLWPWVTLVVVLALVGAGGAAYRSGVADDWL